MYSYRFAVEHSNKLFQVSSAWMHFLTRVTWQPVTLVTLTPVFLPDYGRIERPKLLVEK